MAQKTPKDLALPLKNEQTNDFELLCHLFEKPFGDLFGESAVTSLDEHRVTVTWSPQTTLHAPFDSTVAKLFKNPHQGLTLFLVAKDGKRCVQLGGLVRPVQSLKEGSSAKCGQLLSPGPRESETPLVIQFLKVPEDGKWWRGEPVPLSQWHQELQESTKSE